MYQPLVSIIVPVYKGGEYMRQAIDAALAQTYKNIEIIVVNDGSPDDGETERIALSYGDKIRYFHKENGGCATALNYGISKMQGEWFSWLSHDDLYEPDKVKDEIDAVEKNNYMGKNVVIACDQGIIDSNGNTIFRPVKQKTGYFNSDEMFEYLLTKGTFNGCGLLIPKNVLDSLGEFRTDYKYILDWEYLIRMAVNDVSIYVLDKKLVKNRVHRNQVTVSHSDLLSKENLMLTKELKDSFAKNQKYDLLKVLLKFCNVAEFKEEVGEIEKILRENGKLSQSDLMKTKIHLFKRNFVKIGRRIYKMIIRR